MATSDNSNGNGSSTKSTRYAQAVGRATGQEMTVRPDQPAAEIVKVEVPPGYGSIIETWTPEQAHIEMAKGDLEWAPRVLNLQEGMCIHGILEGRGDDVELEEVDRIKQTVAVKLVGTWVIRDERTGLRASFLTAAQLERKLPVFVGSKVKIFVGAMLESRKGHRYRDFLVGGAKREDGKPRSFARALPAPTIDVPDDLGEELLDQPSHASGAV